jgi:hypothetical protein
MHTIIAVRSHSYEYQRVLNYFYGYSFPIAMMYDDIASTVALYTGLMPCFLVIMLGGADAMPEEKREFTYKVFMPKALQRCAMRVAVTA